MNAEFVGRLEQGLFNTREAAGEINLLVAGKESFLVVHPSVHACSKVMLYSTKRGSLSCLFNADLSLTSFGGIARYGAPPKEDLEIVTSDFPGYRFAFLGDLDPLDMIVCLWLQAVLGPDRVIRIGVNDEMLNLMPEEILRRSLIIWDEEDHAIWQEFADLFPEDKLQFLLGPRSVQLFREQRKIAVEALANMIPTATTAAWLADRVSALATAQ